MFAAAAVASNLVPDQFDLGMRSAGVVVAPFVCKRIVRNGDHGFGVRAAFHDRYCVAVCASYLFRSVFGGNSDIRVYDADDDLYLSAVGGF